MASLNKCFFIGRLGKDPDMNYTQSGIAVARCSLAVDNGKDAQGNKQVPEWLNLVFWRGRAEYASEYLHKGSLVYVETKLSQRKYTGKDGVERTAVEFIVQDVQKLSFVESNNTPSDFMAIDDLGELDDTPF